MALTHIDPSQIDGIKLRCRNTRAFLGVANCDISQQQQEQFSDCQDETRSNRRSHLDLGEGELIVATNRLFWIRESKGGYQLNDKNSPANGPSSNQGLILDYVDISLHAVSRDYETFPHKCIYMVVDKTFPEALSLVQDGQASIVQSPGQENDYSDDDDGQTLSTDMFFVPHDENTLDAIFRALSDCQAMHPDPEDRDYSEDSPNRQDRSDDEEDVETRGVDDLCIFDENLYESVDD